jgi:peptidoglycan hydrolase-like protein with peptidoglycan-binding domain
MTIKITQSKYLPLGIVCALSMTSLLLGTMAAKAATSSDQKPSNTTAHLAATPSTPKTGTTPSTQKPSSTTTHSATNTNQALSLGSRGQAVTTLQTFLKQKGIYKGNVNGMFDAGTRLAVKQFQRSQKLKADGIVGRHTMDALHRAGLG